LREGGRTSEISYPWKCKLTKDRETCPKVPPFEAVSKACKAIGLRLVAQPVRDSALPRS